MGLDMFVYTTRQGPRKEVDFKVPKTKQKLIHHWFKHPNLHAWMEQLYWSRGGKGIDHANDFGRCFNGANLVLGAEDLDHLEKAIKNDELPESEGGFFFGKSDGTETEDDLGFIRKARQAIAAGLTVFYSSWW
jgi:hypothetical protein